VEVPSGEDDVTKKSAGNDTGDGGASSAEPVAPNLIRSNTPRQTYPSIVDRAASTDPPVGGRRHKSPLPVPSGNKRLLQQIM
jgi:hypothetical protein